MCDNLTRENAIFVLNTIFAEIYASVEFYNEYLLTLKGKNVEEYTDDRWIRMNITLSFTVLGCNKIIEFNKKYNRLMNELIPEFNENRKNLITGINNRKIPSFRNDIVGHIHCQRLKRPLNTKEYQARISELTGGTSDIDEFFNWLRPIDPKHMSQQYSVCGEIKEMREALEPVI
ncbi:MAG: hypothetical protein ACI8SJ_000140 [Shewanella sp.]|jgi:hypothetical protein